MTLQTERLRTMEQVRAFIEGSEPVDYKPKDRACAYAFVRRTPSSSAEIAATGKAASPIHPEAGLQVVPVPGQWFPPAGKASRAPKFDRVERPHGSTARRRDGRIGSHRS